MSGGQTSAQKDSSKSLQKAASIQDDIALQTLTDPLFLQRRQLSEQLINDPLTFGPAQREALMQQRAAVANQGARDFLDNSIESASSARSGSVVNDQILAASGLGQELAQARQEIELAGAAQDRQDLINSLGLIDNQLAISNAPEQARVQTSLGVGQTFAGFGPEQSGPLGALGGLLGAGVGGLTGNSGLFGKK